MWEGQLEATNLTPHLVLHDKNTIVNAVTASGVFAAASILIKSLFPQLSLDEGGGFLHLMPPRTVTD